MKVSKFNKDFKNVKCERRERLEGLDNVIFYFF